ncbi:MAG TPA: DUF4349 domain-containing protein [Anaerolineales bacterium]|nr:DUF4349 domain-containing protein [Anaerolineales bacterium]
MVGRLRQFRYWNWAGWIVAGVLVILFVLLPLVSRMSTPYFYELSSVGDREAVAYVAATQVVSMPAPTEAPAAPAVALGNGSPAVTERLIIHNGSMTLIVNDTRAAEQEIEQLVNSMSGEGAFVVSASERGGSDDRPPDVDMFIRVPATRFDEAMDKLAAMAVEVTDRYESADDVTEEYVDLKARMESLETARKRLLEIMQNAATTEELLMAEQQLTYRETEIESIKGRMQYLEQSARLSSISVYLRPYILGQPISTGWRPAETVRKSVERLVQRFENFGAWLIGFVIADLPWLIFYGVVVYAAVRFGRWWWRRRQRKEKPTTEIRNDQ